MELLRARSWSCSDMKRPSETVKHPPGDSSCPSSTNVHTSSTTRPFLTRGIKRLLERGLSKTRHRVGELLRSRGAQLQVLLNHPPDRRRHFLVFQAGALDHADGGSLVCASAKQDLVEFFAFLVDAKDADMADMVVAARIDATRDIDMQCADLVLEFRVGEQRLDIVGDG